MSDEIEQKVSVVINYMDLQAKRMEQLITMVSTLSSAILDLQQRIKALEEKQS